MPYFLRLASLALTLLAVPAAAFERPLPRQTTGPLSSGPNTIREPGSTGPIDGMSVTPPRGYAYTLGERAVDEVNVMADIPPTLRAGVRSGANTTDLTPHIQRALNRGKPVYFPPGAYKICDKLTQATGQKLLGAGVTLARLIVGSCFNMSASAVLATTPGDSSGIDGLGIAFDQSAATNRATIVQYPWALDIRAATRYSFGRFRISAGWNGIIAVGNAGGLNADLLEIGVFNRGVILDGLLDFAHINTLHCWQFDFAGSATLFNIAVDGSTVCAEIGRVDGLDIKSLNAHRNAVLFNANGNFGAARIVGSLQLDGDGSRLEFNAGAANIGIIASTKSEGADQASIIMRGGQLIASITNVSSSTTTSDIQVTGGVFRSNGGSLFNGSAVGRAVLVNGGRAYFRDTWFNLTDGGVTRQTPYVLQTGAGSLSISGSFATPRGSLTGDLIVLQTDVAGNFIFGNDMGGWGYTPPTSTANGYYGPNH